MRIAIAAGPQLPDALRAVDEEVDEVVANPVELRIVMNRFAAAPARHRIDDDFRDPCLRAVAHEHDTVGEQDRLVHVMSDHEYGLIDLPADAQ